MRDRESFLYFNPSHIILQAERKRRDRREKEFYYIEKSSGGITIKILYNKVSRE